jgi:hypothetical protein
VLETLKNTGFCNRVLYLCRNNTVAFVKSKISATLELERLQTKGLERLQTEIGGFRKVPYCTSKHAEFKLPADAGGSMEKRKLR